MAHIVFIGLGNMGRPMAANLQKANHSVTGFDLSAEARAAAAEAGLKVAASEDGLFAGADVVITMLPSGAAVREVWSRAVPQMAPGALMIDSSTIDVTSSRAAHDLAATAGLLSLDAPVSGGTEGATAGTLTFMAGGTDEAFAVGQPLLAAMGRRIVHCGGPGNGEVAKICNNMILGVSMIAVSEAFNLAESLGLSHQALFEVASTSSGQCYALTTHCPVPGPVPTASANRGYTPGFATELMAKDLRLSQEAADASGSRTPLGAAAEDIFGRYAANGGRGRDYSAVISYLKTL
ncbi:3-hydroxyisobutyrate dehydrogenase [Xanthobacter flavus]|uniref:3-hydroxyisobutyrate dehydrogenase n=1 Tax=Xanthobacter flavus TaxID=281 RepID=A0ABU1KCC6_XANFL|nr:3-hydroxyisobutyrate dehydrogenase [Xanthobacter flavus]MBN8915385.1 3-hydroxyisobutyrate dehydrogenase [Hyphomicrobiales bacterium]MDR6332473.1 3-hydroxyisobutyrate dehydrogenase [Xanthobacter flavus]